MPTAQALTASMCGAKKWPNMMRANEHTEHTVSANKDGRVRTKIIRCGLNSEVVQLADRIS